jgi:phosphate transport system substrate-binding protein
LKINIVYILIFFVVIIYSCGNESSGDKIYVDSIAVDENISPLFITVLQDFTCRFQNNKLNYKISTTRNTTSEFVGADIKMILISREFDNEEGSKLNENKIEYNDFPVAYDAIGFIVNPDNPVERITSDDIKKIFSGEYKLWTDLNVLLERGVDSLEQNKAVQKIMKGNERNIKLFIQRQNSSVFSYVKDSVMLGTDYSKSAQICSTSVQMLESVRKNKGAIGIINLCWLAKGEADKLDSTVKPLRISKIFSNGKRDEFRQLHQGLVATKKYPYIRKVMLYTTTIASKLNSGFINYLLKTNGQESVLKWGLVPATQPVRTIQLN